MEWNKIQKYEGNHLNNNDFEGIIIIKKAVE